jgi:hypothetical protein
VEQQEHIYTGGAVLQRSVSSRNIALYELPLGGARQGFFSEVMQVIAEYLCQITDNAAGVAKLRGKVSYCLAVFNETAFHKAVLESMGNLSARYNSAVRATAYLIHFVVLVVEHKESAHASLILLTILEIGVDSDRVLGLVRCRLFFQIINHACLDEHTALGRGLGRGVCAVQFQIGTKPTGTTPRSPLETILNGTSLYSTVRSIRCCDHLITMGLLSGPKADSSMRMMSPFETTMI